MRTRAAGAVLLAAVMLAACGDETEDESAGAVAGAAVGTSSSTSAGSSAEGPAEEPAADGGASSDEPPAPSPSSACPEGEAAPAGDAETTPPTTIVGMEPTEMPNGLMSDEMLPLFGQLVVDVEPQGCIDIPTELRAAQRLQVFTHADDGKVTHIELFAPDGASLGTWDTGEPETLEGLDFYNGDNLPAHGTYTFRVTHESGSDEPFVIAFYGQP